MIISDPGNPEAEEKVNRAVRELIPRLPLVGLLLLGEHLRVRAWPAVNMWSTDGQNINYNPQYVARQSLGDVMFDLVHEWLHVFGNDGSRRGDRDLDLWGIAIDYSVILQAMHLLKVHRPSKDSLEPPLWAASLSKEDIYQRLLDDASLRPKGNRKPCPLFSPPRDPAYVQGLRAETTRAIEVDNRFRRKGESFESRYGRHLTSRFQRLLSDPVPWERLVIGRLQGAIGPGKLSWNPPNLRYWNDDIVLQRMRIRQQDRLVIAVDVSASMSQTAVDQAISCVTGAARRAKEVTVIVFDQVVREKVVTKDPNTVLRNLKFLTGSHGFTDASIVFDTLEAQEASAIVIFTDGYVKLPEKVPTADVLWVLVPGTSTAMAWGDVFIMEEPW